MRLFTALLFAALPMGAQSSAECDRGGVLSPGGVGALRIHMSVDSLHHVCRVIRSIPLADYTLLVVRVGSDSVRAFAQGGRVAWISVSSRAYRAADSLGVGSPVGPLLELPDMTGGPGDGTDRYVIYARSGPLCGLAFWLEPRAAEVANAMRRTSNVFRQLQMRDPGVIASIDIHGSCRAGDRFARSPEEP